MTGKQWLLPGVLFALLLILLCVLVVAIVRLHSILKGLEEMMEAVEQGAYWEKHFDETRISRLEARLGKYLIQNRLSKEHLQQERNGIEKIVSDISHQTKTPISNILLYTELLQERELDPATAGMVRQVELQTERLRFITDSLVKVSRLENDIIRLAPTRQSLLPLAQELAEEYKEVAARRGIRLELEYESPAPEAVFDYKWTAEALANLLDNSIKYTALRYEQEGGGGEKGRIVIRLKNYEMYHMIEICDNGIGIPEEEQGAIFGRFYRGKQVQSLEGVGIGLYLAREIASKEMGYIRVRSRQGEGAEFALFLQA